jgi:ABC-type multidrug transport system ATPase subunit
VGRYIHSGHFWGLLTQQPQQQPNRNRPTTGLDPATRQNIWKLITSLSTPERAIVITTHQMIEADTLCNRIAIMAKGKLVVVGTQQYLKSRFGSGFVLQLNLVHNTVENEAAALAFCRDHLHPGAAKKSKQAKTLHVHLPPNLSLQQAFAALYDPTVRPGCINQFLLNQSSLEDVFLALGDGYSQTFSGEAV